MKRPDFRIIPIIEIGIGRLKDHIGSEIILNSKNLRNHSATEK